MTVKELIDVIYELQGRPDKFNRAFWKRRINSIMKDLLYEGQIQIVRNSVTASTGDSSEALTGDINHIRNIKFLKNDAELDLDLTTKQDLDLLTLTSTAPSAFVIEENAGVPTVYFDALIDEDIDIHYEYSAKMSDDLDEDDDLQTVISSFKDNFNSYLEDLLMDSINLDTDAFYKKKRVFINRIKNLVYNKAYVRKEPVSYWSSIE